MFSIAGWAHGSVAGEERGVALMHMMSAQLRAPLKGQAVLPGIALAQGGGELATVKLDDRWVVAAADGFITNQGELDDGWDAPATPAQSVLAAYLKHGAGFCAKLRGAFSAAVWDGEKRALLLVRDPLGLRPLFYTTDARGTRFASSLDALLTAPGVRRHLSREGVAQLLGLGPARMPGETPLTGIREVPAGCMLTCTEADGQRISRYWKLQPSCFEGTERDAAERVLELLTQSVAAHAPSLPVAFLSGGLDSSLLCALAAPHYRALGERLRTYSIDYASPTATDDYLVSDDRPYVRQMASFLDTDHRQVVATANGLARALTDALRARCLPGMADVDASLLLLCRAARGSCVMLGEGADEIFGGYPWYHRPELYTLPTFPWSPEMALRQTLLHPQLRGKLNLAELARERFEALLAEAEVEEENPALERRRRLQYVCLSTFGANLLERADRMSAFYGSEARLPFMDTELVQLCYSLPWRILDAGNTPKGVLRLAAKELLPPEICQRRKSPFPKTTDPAYEYAVRGLLVRALDNRDAPLRQLIDVDAALSPANPSAPFFGQLMRLPQLHGYLWQINEWLMRFGVELGI